MSRTVTHQDVIDELVVRGGKPALTIINKWEKKTATHRVVNLAGREFKPQHIFSLRTADVDAVLERGEHALGDVQTKEQDRGIQNATCVFPFSYCFHIMLEETGRLPTYLEFMDWLENKRPELVWNELRGPNEEKRRALQWRMGNLYYSWLREISVLAAFWENYQIPLQFHIVADVRLKVDFWYGRHLIAIYVPNSRYLDREEGRKQSVREIFGEPPFKIHTVPIDHNGFGDLWRANKGKMDEIAQHIAAHP